VVNLLLTFELGVVS